MAVIDMVGVTESGTIRAEYDWAEITPSIAIINAVAAVENVEAAKLSSELAMVLYDYVDPEALDTIVTTGSEITISFSYGAYRVRIDGNELIISSD